MPSIFAVITAVPFAFAVTTPVALTVATFLALEDQVTDLVPTPISSSVRVSPFFRVALVVDNSGSAMTVTVAYMGRSSVMYAVIVVLPTFNALIVPAAEIEATFFLLFCQTGSNPWRFCTFNFAV